MLIIRKEQMQILSGHMRVNFRNRMAELVRKRFKEKFESQSDEAVFAFIDHGISRAQNHGIGSRQDVRRYVLFMAAHGRDFDTEQEWARRVIAKPNLSGAGRLDLLEAYETFQLGRG